MNDVRRWMLVATLVFVGAWAVDGGSVAETPEELFEAGNSAYETGRFGEAAEAYRTALRYGIRDDRVEYNLGNAEFKLGNLGQAILHYRRAMRLAPTDPDIRANLRLVESYCADQVEAPEPAAAVRFVRGVQDRVGPDAQALVCLALYWILLALVGWCTAKPGGWNAIAGWTLAGLLLLLTLGGLSWLSTYQRLEGQPLAVVLEEAVEVLAGPGENNATLFTVHEGLTVEIRGRRGDWIQASLPNGLNGWMPRESVEPV